MGKLIHGKPSPSGSPRALNTRTSQLLAQSFLRRKILATTGTYNRVITEVGDLGISYFSRASDADFIEGPVLAVNGLAAVVHLQPLLVRMNQKSAFDRSPVHIVSSSMKITDKITSFMPLPPPSLTSPSTFPFLSTRLGLNTRVVVSRAGV